MGKWFLTQPVLYRDILFTALSFRHFFIILFFMSLMTSNVGTLTLNLSQSFCSFDLLPVSPLSHQPTFSFTDCLFFFLSHSISVPVLSILTLSKSIYSCLYCLLFHVAHPCQFIPDWLDTAVIYILLFNVFKITIFILCSRWSVQFSTLGFFYSTMHYNNTIVCFLITISKEMVEIIFTLSFFLCLCMD